jgi:hypothetical protein
MGFILKVLFLLAAVLILWIAVFRGIGLMGKKVSKRPKNPLSSVELKKCDRCGIYLPSGQTCDCSDRA